MDTKCKLVIIDDNDKCRELLKDCVNATDDIILVGEAGDGQQGMECIKRTDPDVVLLDISMPYMDGMDTLKRLKITNQRPAVIILSSNQNDSVIQEAMRNGAVYYVVKPFNEIELMKKILFFAGTNNINEFKNINLSIKTTVSPCPYIDVKSALSSLLKKMGVFPKLKGYWYLKMGIEKILSFKNERYMITKDIYPYLAKENSTTIMKAERAIRHAISVVWKDTDQEIVRYLFKEHIEKFKRPTNTEFMSSLAEYLNLTYGY